MENLTCFHAHLIVNIMYNYSISYYEKNMHIYKILIVRDHLLVATIQGI
jgi:hypothetical protein